ncbi:MAG TPA: SPOR domain-containing protein [Bacteroidales bacterium]
MLSKYLKNLLEFHSRVIVPDLGAFMLKGDSSKTIYFNEFLRFNDGLLVDHIAEQEHINKIDAVRKIKAFVDSVNKQLTDNKSVEIEGIGTLYLDINEKIQLKIPFVPGTQNLEPINQQTENQSREIDFEIEKKEPASVKSPVSEKNIPEAQPKPASIETPSAKEIKTTVGPTDKPKETATPKVKSSTPPPQSKNKDNIEVVPTTTRRLVIVSILGVLIIGTIIFFAFLQSHKSRNQNITLGTSIPTDSVAKSADSSSKEAVAESPETKPAIGQTTVKKQPNASTKTGDKSTVKPSKENKVKPDPVKANDAGLSKSTAKRYYIVAGTFSNESNADKMLRKLKKEGYHALKIRNETTNLFYVSYLSFTNKDSANIEIKKIRAAGNDAWIYSK